MKAHRRRFLLLLATSASAGCLGGGTSEAGEAEAAVETFFIRIRDGDLEGANEMVADEGPLGRIDESVVESAEYAEVDTETVVVQDETAIVRVTLIYESGDPDELEVGLRKIDDEWLVWEQLDNP